MSRPGSRSTSRPSSSTGRWRISNRPSLVEVGSRAAVDEGRQAIRPAGRHGWREDRSPSHHPVNDNPRRPSRRCKPPAGLREETSLIDPTVPAAVVGVLVGAAGASVAPPPQAASSRMSIQVINRTCSFIVSLPLLTVSVLPSILSQARPKGAGTAGDCEQATNYTGNSIQARQIARRHPGPLASLLAG